MRLHTQADTEDRRTVTYSVPAGLTQQCTEVEGAAWGSGTPPSLQQLKRLAEKAAGMQNGWTVTKSKAKSREPGVCPERNEL